MPRTAITTDTIAKPVGPFSPAVHVGEINEVGAAFELDVIAR